MHDEDNDGRFPDESPVKVRYRDPLLPLVPDTRTGYEPAATAGVDRVVP